MCMLSGCDSSKNDNNNNANKLSSESMPDFQYMFKFEGLISPHKYQIADITIK